MTKSIKSQVIALGKEEWEKHRAKNDYPDWHGCLLVNPYCPSDLCVLPADHVGTAEGWHCLGTDAYDDPLRIRESQAWFLHEPGATREMLIEAGARKLRELEDG